MERFRRAAALVGELPFSTKQFQHIQILGLSARKSETGKSMNWFATMAYPNEWKNGDDFLNSTLTLTQPLAPKLYPSIPHAAFCMIWSPHLHAEIHGMDPGQDIGGYAPIVEPWRTIPSFLVAGGRENSYLTLLAVGNFGCPIPKNTFIVNKYCIWLEC